MVILDIFILPSSNAMLSGGTMERSGIANQ